VVMPIVRVVSEGGGNRWGSIETKLSNYMGYPLVWNWAMCIQLVIPIPIYKCLGGRPKNRNYEAQNSSANEKKENIVRNEE